eukprot:6481922-Prymnesium_polylepis.1
MDSVPGADADHDANIAARARTRRHGHVQHARIRLAVRPSPGYRDASVGRQPVLPLWAQDAAGRAGECAGKVRWASDKLGQEQCFLACVGVHLARNRPTSCFVESSPLRSNRQGTAVQSGRLFE